jgi:hypothetical protein
VVSGLSGALGGPAMIGNALAIVCCGTSLLGAVVFGIGCRYFSGNDEPARLREVSRA